MPLKDLASSAMGKLEKACLVIHEVNDEGALKNTQALSKFTSSVLEKASDPQSNPGSTAMSKFGFNVPVADGLRTHVMQVQYNPSSLHIQANAEQIPFTFLQQNIDAGVPNQNMRPPMVVLSVEMFFDAMNPADAFMFDKLRLSLGSAVSDVAGVMKSKMGGYTVQKQTNGLVATVLRPKTKTVTFHWADMAFTGEVIEVEANYIMFSVSGKPIRSKVRMNISQKVESEADREYWRSALDNVFAEGNTAILKNTDQKVGNLLNLKAF